MISSRRARVLLAALSVFGVAQLSFLLGAAVILLHLPSWQLLSNAYIGVESYFKRQRDIERETRGDASNLEEIREKIDRPGQTYDGYTLCIEAPNFPYAVLLDMNQKVVHKWDLRYSRIWPEKPQHIEHFSDDVIVIPFFVYLYGNGDLLVNFHGNGNGVSNGYGVVKLDKDSNIIWKYASNVHHDLDVAEDGTIYALEQHILRKPLRGLEFLADPCMVDYLITLTPDGKKTGELSILECLRDSPYRGLLGKLEVPFLRGVQKPPTISDDSYRRDVMHTNHVQVLTSRLAPKFPMFKAGQIMVSSRHMDVISVLDFQERKLVWAARGPWHEQHDPEFLDNGHILLFDNQGAQGFRQTRDTQQTGKYASRVMEFDPVTQTVPWCLSGHTDLPKGIPFYTFERGTNQRLANGNTLITDSHDRQILEVTADKQLVWRCPREHNVNFSRRYGPDELTFLDKGIRPR